MSRTRHHRSQKDAKIGCDFGYRYRCNKLYGVGTGSIAKDKAGSERRADSRDLTRRDAWNG